jgi:hypothetical protein
VQQVAQIRAKVAAVQAVETTVQQAEAAHYM